MDRAARDRVAPADPAGQDRVALVSREAPMDLVSRAAPAVPVGRADRGAPGDVSRAAQVGTVDMDLVALANRVDPVGMSPVAPADRVVPANLVGMSLAGRVARANLVGMSPVVPANRVARADRAVRDPGQSRALLGRNPVPPPRAVPTRAHPRPPDPDPMRAHPHLTRVRQQEPTHREAAAHRPVATHPAEETPVAAHPAEEATHEADIEGVAPNYREFRSRAHNFDDAVANYLGAQMNNQKGQHAYRATLYCSGRGRRTGISRFGRCHGGASPAGPFPAMVPR